MRRKNRDFDIAVGLACFMWLGVFLFRNSIEFRKMVYLTGGIVSLFLCFILWRSYVRARESTEEDPIESDPLVGNPYTRALAQKMLRTADFPGKLRTIDWYQFEKLIGSLYQKQGYSVSHSGGANPDGGIDLVVEKGIERVAIQCKHWKRWRVGVRNVRELLGALSASGIPKGILVTIQGYTNEAREFADKHGIVILDEADIVNMYNDTGAPYDSAIDALLNDTRKFCPKCQSQMVLRTANKGTNAGSHFWGCSKYPACRFILPED